MTTEQQLLFDKHRAWAEAIARETVSRHNWQRAFGLEDAMQHALIGLWHSCLAFDPSVVPPSKFRRFAFRRVRGAVLDAFRTLFGRGRRKANIANANQGGAVVARGDLIDSLSAPCRALKALENLDECRAYLRRLHSRAATIVRLYYLHGLNLDEVASRLRISESRASQIMAEVLSGWSVARGEGPKASLKEFHNHTSRKGAVA